MELAGAVAVVTGGGSGIGRATALRLARDGAAVAVADIDEPGARETSRLIEAAAGRAMPIRADVADEADARAMVDRARERFGRLDILVNNAGVVEHAQSAGRLELPGVAGDRAGHDDPARRDRGGGRPDHRR